MSGIAKPLRQNVALAIDGGGIKGAMVARALMHVEQALGKPLNDFVRLTAGTSTGAIIAAGIARGMNAGTIHELYVRLGPEVFRRSWRNWPLIKYLVRYQYPLGPLEKALAARLGDVTIGQVHAARPDFHMVITATDVYAKRTRFIKLYKPRYADWKLRDAVLASSIVPTVFPVFKHHFATPEMPADPGEEWIPEPRYWVDGGVGSYSNPCYMAAYEAAFCLRSRGWRPDNTTLISIGTGNAPPQAAWQAALSNFRRTPRELYGPEWVFPTLDTFLHDANQQQVRLVQHFFVDSIIAQTGDPAAALDFRRYNINFNEPIEMDEADAVGKLSLYGNELGRMIIEDEREDFGAFSCGEPMVFQMLSETPEGQAYVV